jgi:hypothetical protein
LKQDISFYATASQNLITIHHVRKVIDRLKKKGPEILFFRGISLLGDVYPQLGDRRMLDVDILVRERDLARLKKVLATLGLEETEQGVFCKPGLLLDIHTSFLTPIRSTLGRSCLTISLEEVFQQSIPKPLDDIEIKIPCPAHLFISTAFHLQSHSFFGGKGWKDLIKIKQYYDLSDEKILFEARSMGAEQTLYYLSYLHPDLFSSWRKKLSLSERWILKRVREGTSNQNFGDLLFLFQSKRKIQSLKEIFFPQGFSLSIICNRMMKCLRLLKDTLFGRFNATHKVEL